MGEPPQRSQGGQRWKKEEVKVEKREKAGGSGPISIAHGTFVTDTERRAGRETQSLSVNVPNMETTNFSWEKDKPR